jgi:hypothetical protein
VPNSEVKYHEERFKLLRDSPSVIRNMEESEREESSLLVSKIRALIKISEQM